MGWTSVASSTDGTKLAAAAVGGGGGSIYTSTDSGVTWMERTTAGSRHWRSITSSADGTKFAAVAIGAYIYTSTDSGATWTEQTVDGSAQWISIAISADGTKLAATVYGGFIYTSTDSGATWTEQTAVGTHYWESIASSADGTKLAAVVYGGNIYLGTTEGPATDTFAMQSLAPIANQAASPTVSQAALSVTSSACYSIDKPNVRTLNTTSLSVPEQTITLLGGVTFDVTCATTGGSTDATLRLGQHYTDLSQLRVYKQDSTTGGLTDITSLVTLANINGTTIIAYTLTDGGDYDEDGLANGVIVDPIYVGVVAGAASGGGALANTGLSIWSISAIGVSLVGLGALVTRKIIHRQERVSFNTRS